MKWFLLLLLVPASALSMTKHDLGPNQSCRSQGVAHKFEVAQGYPKGRPGWIIDHVCSLFEGGIDDPSNMQYQTYPDSVAKNKIENTPAGKAKWCNEKNSTPERRVFNCKSAVRLKPKVQNEQKHQ